MPCLLNLFNLKPSVDRAEFERAWQAFGEYLESADLAAECGAVKDRVPTSGYDTDTERAHILMAVITFRDQAQADAAWAAIEANAPPLAPLHRAVFARVHDPVFTFWQ
ncbi:MAG: hypothetical protein AB3N13_08400 [Arenibacterium sp.]